MEPWKVGPGTFRGMVSDGMETTLTLLWLARWLAQDNSFVWLIIWPYIGVRWQDDIRGDLSSSIQPVTPPHDHSTVHSPHDNTNKLVVNQKANQTLTNKRTRAPRIEIKESLGVYVQNGFDCSRGQQWEQEQSPPPPPRPSTGSLIASHRSKEQQQQKEEKQI